MYAVNDLPTDKLCVLNSDIYHRSRLLQHRVKAPQSFKPGQYDYYQGKIVAE
jgi:hypothetical protein